MKRLTKAEEEIMQIIWRLGRCTVRDIREDIGGEPLQKHTTVSTIVRLIEKKGFLGHKAYGRTYEYFPIIAKEDYSKQTLHKFVNEYFDGSMNRLVSFMVKEDDLSLDELSDLLDKLEE
ncbi:MAG: BlaI/MecI/CopY family transcriptional regulator [Bacteroidota bacterium]